MFNLRMFENSLFRGNKHKLLATIVKHEFKYMQDIFNIHRL